MRLAWRLLRSDLRHGELWLLFFALVLAVAATTSLRFLSASLDQGLQRQAASLLAADLVLSSSRPLRQDVMDDSRQRGLLGTAVIEFSSMVQHGERFQLAAVKAVAPAYPLRGELLARRGGNPLSPATRVQPGEIWLDDRLAQLLDVGPGDRVRLGELDLVVTAILVQEPDRAGNVAAFAPRALMHLDDVPGAGVIQPGSRVQYRWLMAGDSAAVAAQQRALDNRLAIGERLLDIRRGRPEIGTPLSRALDTLSLAAMLTVVLSGLAVALAAGRHVRRQTDAVALMRCLGASRQELKRLYGMQLFVIWLAALLLGGGLGALASALLFQVLQGLLPDIGQVFAWQAPLLTGMATASLTLVGFALPALLNLLQVSPLRVLRRDLLPMPPRLWLITALAMAALGLLLWLETGNARLSIGVLVAGSLLALLLALLLRSLLALLRRHGQERPLPSAVQGLRELWRHPAAATTQIMALALGMAAMLLVTHISSSLLDSWQNRLPADAPNQFALGIADDERDAVLDTLAGAGIARPALYPVIRGRLVAINDEPVQTRISKESSDEDARSSEESLNRELNLTVSDRLPAGNRLIAGRWWENDIASQAIHPVSVESRLAERLGLSLGDRLRFSLAEGDVQARVSSLREVDWDSFQPNFYMVFPPAALAGFPASYLTGFHVRDDQRQVLNTLVNDFPALVLIDVQALMQQVRSLLAQVSLAIRVVLSFVLVAGVLVLLACLAASLDQRREEAALLRALGASQRELARRLISELAMLGLLAGMLAAGLATAVAVIVQTQVLDMPAQADPLLWLLTPLAGSVLAMLAGWLGMRRIWTTPPARVLRGE